MALMMKKILNFSRIQGFFKPPGVDWDQDKETKPKSGGSGAPESGPSPQDLKIPRCRPLKVDGAGAGRRDALCFLERAESILSR